MKLQQDGKQDWAGSHRNSGVHSWTAEELVLPSPKLKNRGQIQDWSSRGTSCFAQVQIWPPLFINPAVNAALDLPVIFTVVIIPLSAVPWFPWVSRGWWVFQLPLESAQMPLSPWWRPRLSSTTVDTWTRQNGLIQSPRILSPYWQKKLFSFWSIVTNYVTKRRPEKDLQWWSFGSEGFNFSSSSLGHWHLLEVSGWEFCISIETTWSFFLLNSWTKRFQGKTNFPAFHVL